VPITTTPSGGTQGEFSTYTPIYAQTLSATTASITFSNIPTTFTDLVLVVNAASETTHAFLNMQFNGDTASNYSYTEMLGNGTSATSTRYTGAAQMFNANVAMQQTTISFNGIYQIMNYSNATTNKTGLARLNCQNSDYNGSIGIVGTWRNTSPITSIKVFPSRGGTPYNFSIGSTFTLYGIKAAAPAPKATGGDVITTDGTYWYHAFKNSGVFSLAPAVSSLTANVLVVAGGGGGGTTAGGGGGAGGLRLLTSQTMSSQTTVTVGAGGSGTGLQGSYFAAPSGTLTSFGSIAVTGGGGGGNDAGTGRNGGSGGGGGGSSIGTHLGGSGNAGGYSPVEGYAGGNSTSAAAQYAAPGGGGSGGAGNNNPNSNTGGAGGIGSNTYNSEVFTSWLTATSTGVSGYLAGGGGGGVYASGTGGAGGSGGGGAGGGTDSSYGTSGVASTGSGGGGGRPGGGNGGSGLVIVRYAV
jgi:uncharacterized protein (UPF0333 family)